MESSYGLPPFDWLRTPRPGRGARSRECDGRGRFLTRAFRSAAESSRRMTPERASVTLCAEVFYMRRIVFLVVICGLITGLVIPTLAQRAAEPAPPAASEPDDPVKTLVGRLELETYKATVKGLTQFGDRRQGTDRNRMAVDWIEAQLKSYGCPTDRIKYEYQPPENQGRGGAGRGGGGRGPDQAQGGGRLRGIRARTGVNTDPTAQP